ncbi:MAG: VIT domain-containing protein [Pseudomonadota bacterium]
MKRSNAMKALICLTAIAMLCVIAQPDADAGKKKKVPDVKKVLKDAEDQMGTTYVSMGSYNQPVENPEDDKTLSPFFYIADGDPETDRLPLKKTSADVNIAGVIAQVRVHQTFENNGKKPIEAIYVFPASTRAAVHAMRMKIGDRTVEAKIEEREEAKQQYEAAKSEGKRASLLEQQRANVFTMNVANIMPGDKIDVEMDYSELLVPEDATYEFVYPTVVGPRYGGGADPEKDSWISNPYLSEGEPEPYKFDISVNLTTGIDLKEVTSPSHKVDVEYKSKSSARVRLDQDGGGNKDYILRYRLAGDKIESGILTYKHDDENFFVVMMEPPEKPKSSQIPSREYIFVLDVSGSMYGFPLDTAKEVMKKLLGDLRSNDYFNVVLFAGTSYKMSEKSLQATDSNIKKAMDVVDKQQGGGGTELMDALRNAYSIKKVESSGVSRTVVVVTDGYVGVEAQAFKFIRNNLSDSNLFAFGIGSSVNRALIEGMARAGMGEPFVVLKPETAPKQAEKFRTYIESPVLTDIDVKFSGFNTSDVFPEEVPDLMAKRPVVLFGKFKGSASGSVTISGVSGDGKFSKTMSVEKAASEKTQPIRCLWARKWVELLDDQRSMLPQDKELKEAITSLGLNYSILTAFTSFVAIDSEVVNKGGSQTSVKQPLPLPEGVSNYAVGAGSSGNYPAAAMASPGPYKASKKMGSGYYAPKSKGLVDSSDAAAETAEPTVAMEKEEDKDDKEATLSFSFQVDGSKLSLLKRKHLESSIRKVIEKKVPGGKSLNLTILIKLAENGTVTSVKVAGDKGYGLDKALKSELQSLKGLGGTKSIQISISVNT